MLAAPASEAVHMDISLYLIRQFHHFLKNLQFVYKGFIFSVEKMEEIRTKLEQTHQEEFFGLRPEVLLSVYIRNDLWKTFLEGRR